MTKRSKKRVECVIVESERAKGELSIRPMDVRPGEGGKGGTLRKRLAEAGFRVGDLVAIVTSKTGLR